MVRFPTIIIINKTINSRCSCLIQSTSQLILPLKYPSRSTTRKELISLKACLSPNKFHSAHAPHLCPFQKISNTQKITNFLSDTFSHWELVNKSQLFKISKYSLKPMWKANNSEFFLFNGTTMSQSQLVKKFSNILS